MTDQTRLLAKFLADKAEEKYFGTVRLDFRAGAVYLIREEQTKTLESLGEQYAVNAT